MIVIGADTHKATHTCAAVGATTGQLVGELTVAARKPGFVQLLAWGRELDGERIWAIEDCRHSPARLAGVAPIPASSGRRTRQRLARGGNRQLNCALHRIAVCQGRVHPPAREFLAKKQAEGKSRREALRCLKRHLARRVWRLLIDSERETSSSTVDPQRGTLAPHSAIAT
jgi:transposase